MDLKTLRETPPWDWPQDTGKRLADNLRDRGSDGDERLLAAELAGDFTVIDDTLVGTLLSVLRSADESESLRGQAAISLGPALEYADTEGFEEPDEVPIGERTFRDVRESLRRLFRDASVPKDVRGRADPLERRSALRITQVASGQVHTVCRSGPGLRMPATDQQQRPSGTCLLERRTKSPLGCIGRQTGLAKLNHTDAVLQAPLQLLQELAFTCFGRVCQCVDRRQRQPAQNGHGRGQKRRRQAVQRAEPEFLRLAAVRLAGPLEDATEVQTNVRVRILEFAH